VALRAVPDHPKFAELMAALNLPKFATLGCLEAIWHFTGRYAPQGNIGKYSDQAIERWVDWNGTPGKLVESLVNCRWIDRDPNHRLLVHDWHQHADKATKNALMRAKLPFSIPVVRTADVLSTNTKPKSSTAYRLPEPEPVPAPEAKAKAAPPKAPLFVIPEWIPQESWDDFEEMRNKARKPMTDRARAAIVKRLNELRKTGYSVEEVLVQSITNVWADVYPLRERDAGRGLPLNPPQCAPQTQEELDAADRERVLKLDGMSPKFKEENPEYFKARPQ